MFINLDTVAAQYGLAPVTPHIVGHFRVDVASNALLVMHVFPSVWHMLGGFFKTALAPPVVEDIGLCRPKDLCIFRLVHRKSVFSIWSLAL